MISPNPFGLSRSKPGSFDFGVGSKEGGGFDKLSPNGIG